MNYPYLFHFTKKSKQDKSNYNMQTEISGYSGKLQIFKTRQKDLRTRLHALPDRKNTQGERCHIFTSDGYLPGMDILFKRHCMEPVSPSPVAQGEHYQHLSTHSGGSAPPAALGFAFLSTGSTQSLPRFPSCPNFQVRLRSAQHNHAEILTPHFILQRCKEAACFLLFSFSLYEL